MKEIGIPFVQDAFLKDIHRHRSAQSLTEEWWEKYDISATGLEEDYPWFACMTLWERLAPDVMFDERLSDMMQRGYDLIKKQRAIEGCDLWLEVWDHLKARRDGNIRSVEAADKGFCGAQSFYNWCQDLEMELGNLVRHEQSYCSRAAVYFREFCQLLPESSPLILQNMMMAEADALVFSGDIEGGERVFQEVIKRYPGDVWGYIRWGDIYAPGMGFSSVPSDTARARSIYSMALGRGLKEEKEARLRIKRLPAGRK